MKVIYPGPAVDRETGKHSTYHSRTGITLVPGENEVPADAGEMFCASGLTRRAEEAQAPAPPPRSARVKEPAQEPKND